MKKVEAIELLGGTATAAAGSVGISVAAVCKWPDELPPRIVDRIQAALWRKLLVQQKKVRQSPPTPTQEAAHG